MNQLLRKKYLARMFICSEVPSKRTKFGYTLKYSINSAQCISMGYLILRVPGGIFLFYELVPQMYSLLEWLYPPTHPVSYYGGTTQIPFPQQLYLPEEIDYLVRIPPPGIPTGSLDWRPGRPRGENWRLFLDIKLNILPDDYFGSHLIVGTL